VTLICLAALVAPLVVVAALLAARDLRQLDVVNRVAAPICAALIGAVAVVGIAHAGDPVHGSWYLLDGVGGVFLGVIGVVGLISAMTSPVYLHDHRRAHTGAVRSRQFYYGGLYVFWAALVAVPLATNLGVAWLVIEATTAASALLVAFSGSRNALEAGWKYLVLTSVGLSVALMGIVMLYATSAHTSGALAALDWSSLAHHAVRMNHQTTLVAFCFVIAGLATKVGWAPVHNWLPDAHSEAPPPVSALLSAALLPTVALIAWRVDAALRVALNPRAVEAIFVGFGLASLGVAVPFLWKSLAWKRFLAYSSLEHMGVIALGIGFDNRWATAGVLIHVAGHAIAKTLGFSMSIPLLRYQPGASHRAPRGIARLSRPLAFGMGISLVALAGVPPSPLFVSEALILYGGVAAGSLVVVAIACLLLAMGFLGIAHMAIEALGGTPGERRAPGRRTGVWIAGLAGASAAGLVALTCLVYVLPYATIAGAVALGAR
jgi:hydrogenase-4 component F